MTDIGVYSDKEFISGYPIDLGQGIRGHMLHNKHDEPVGILFGHKVDDHICAGSVIWKPGHAPNDRLWKLIELEPLHVEPSVLCSCGLHGYIRNGKWVGVGE